MGKEYKDVVKEQQAWQEAYLSQAFALLFQLQLLLLTLCLLCQKRLLPLNLRSMSVSYHLSC